MILNIIISVGVGLGLAWVWVRRPSITRDAAESDVARPFSGDAVIIELVAPSGQYVTLRTKHLPEHALRSLFEATDMPLQGTSEFSSSEDTREGASLVVAERIDSEVGRLDLRYVLQPAHRGSVALWFPPETRSFLDALYRGDELHLNCRFAQDPGATVVGVFTPA